MSGRGKATVRIATQAQRPALKRLMGEYLEELTRALPSVAPRSQNYPHLDVYWTCRDRYPMVFSCARTLVGFALIRGPSSIDWPGYEVAEFSVAKHYRRHGIGINCAAQVLHRWPGRWRLRCLCDNPSAVAFWDAVIVNHALAPVRIGPVPRDYGDYYRYEFEVSSGAGSLV